MRGLISTMGGIHVVSVLQQLEVVRCLLLVAKLHL